MESFSSTYLAADADNDNSGTRPRSYNIETRHFIDGEFQGSKSCLTFDLINPTTGERSAEVSAAQAEDVDLAVVAAGRASTSWAKRSASDRRAMMLRICDLIDQNVGEFAYLEAISMGKPVANYVDHIIGTSILRYYAGKGHDIRGFTSLTTDTHLNMTLKQPYGVTAAIIPWNVSLIMLCMKIGPSLIAGNTLVLKSSEKSPLTSLLFARLAKQAGLPAGVLNILSGLGLPCGDSLARHMDVRKISFTGSARTGMLVQRAAAESNLKDCTLELGGKSPLVVLEDSDLEKAAQAAAFSIMFNSGQICMASTRVYVQRPVADQFLTLYKEKILQVRGRVGDPLDPQTTSGPVADRQQFNSIKSFLGEAKKQGCSFSLGDVPLEQRGCFVDPVIIWDPPKNSDIVKKEVFGPVVCVIPFDSEDEAIEQANDSDFGLYASVFTRDINRAIRFAKEFEAGTIGINTTSPYHCENLPIGGMKSSGTGRELGLEGLDIWTETKSVFMDLS
ncbi:unnamed protein product [Penicillium olsonii]|uniref:aldehyde dehydrogenase (NAD(+)) n=1 Tax=Penicillium olsonii TaxID=99116 RepID=A0A9W4N6I2_PENOL|nr:unnamed protein product [Penicillium olsonii]CAG8301505.1 unnamed protein product [Penicillium olsonii]